jgi:hypothetical protein
MHKTHAFRVVALISVAIFCVSAYHSVHAAFGISPPFLNADHLVPGATYTQTFYLVQDQPNDDLGINVNLNVPESIRPWIIIDQGLHFVIPKGTHQFPVQLTVHIPKDTGLGVYRGNVTFTGAPAQAGQVTIALGVQSVINLTVGNDIYRKVSVPIIKLLDIEEGWNPKVYVKFNNEGNIPEKFTGATYELLDQYGAVRLAFSQTANGLVETPPFSIKEYVVEFPIDFHLGLGQYWGVVNFYQDQQLIGSQKTIFNVLKKGSLSSQTALILDALKDSWYYYVVGLLVVFFVARLAMRRRRGA